MTNAGSTITTDALPEPNWVPLARIRQRAALAFRDVKSEDIESWLIMAICEGRIEIQGRLERFGSGGFGDKAERRKIDFDKSRLNPARLSIDWHNSGMTETVEFNDRDPFIAVVVDVVALTASLDALLPVPVAATFMQKPDWHPKPGEQQQLWIQRTEVLVELKARWLNWEKTSKRLSRKAFASLLSTMADDAGLSWPAASLETASRNHGLDFAKLCELNSPAQGKR